MATTVAAFAAKDYYQRLNLDPEKSPTDFKEFQDMVRKGYLRQSRVHHPDKGGDEANFKLLKEAQECLSDDFKKSMYDTWLKGDRSQPYKQDDFPGATPLSHPPTPLPSPTAGRRAW